MAASNVSDVRPLLSFATARENDTHHHTCGFLHMLFARLADGTHHARWRQHVDGAVVVCWEIFISKLENGVSNVGWQVGKVFFRN